jgi:hypothetical protein
MPEQDAVLAMISGVRDMQVVLDKVWKHLLPAMQPRALPADRQAYDELCDELAVLALPLPQGRPSSSRAKQWSGKTYKLESNALKLESIAIKFGNKRSTLSVCVEQREHPVQIGYGTWLNGTTDIRGHDNEPIAACGAWTAENTYEVRLCFYDGEYCPVFRFHYKRGQLQLEIEPNVAWEPVMVTTINGRVAG